MVETRDAAPPSTGRAPFPLTGRSEHGLQREYVIDPYAVADGILRRLTASRGASRIPRPLGAHGVLEAVGGRDERHPSPRF